MQHEEPRRGKAKSFRLRMTISPKHPLYATLVGKSSDRERALSIREWSTAYVKLAQLIKSQGWVNTSEIRPGEAIDAPFHARSLGQHKPGPLEIDSEDIQAMSAFMSEWK